MRNGALGWRRRQVRTANVLTWLLMPLPGPSFLAFDLGAETGRAYLGSLRSGSLDLREIHRFRNEPVEYGSALHWDVPRLWREICKVLCEIEDTPLAGIGVDAWGVDYALIGEQGELLQNPRHYRDPRNVTAMQEVLDLVPRDEIYRATGIQFMPINTLNQLFAASRDTPRLLAAAEKLVMIPDLFHYWITGNAVCEFTAATTTQFVNVATRTWDRGLLSRLGLPAHLPAEIVEPGSVVGTYRGTPVITPASHDTASAVAAITARDGVAFISSGTWSLVGIELDAPVISSEALQLNFTNEGGVSETTRLLKNVMGLWMLQRCRRSSSYEELMEAAAEAPAFHALVDPDDVAFLNPADMPSAIDRVCARSGQPVPDSPGSYARTILESLALKYRIVIDDLEKLTGCPIHEIRVVGGGSRNRLLNQFTAGATGRRVLAGPAEAAALGNIAVQMVATRAVGCLAEARQIIARSFPPKVFEPSGTASWNEAAGRVLTYA